MDCGLTHQACVSSEHLEVCIELRGVYLPGWVSVSVKVRATEHVLVQTLLALYLLAQVYVNFF